MNKKAATVHGCFFVVPEEMSFYQENRTKQKRFYSGKKWKKLRDMYLAEHPLCERCLKAGRAQVAEHVHHKIELTESNYNDPMISLNPEYLEALCFDCHSKEHHQGDEIGKEFYFDSDGNICQKNEEQPGAVS